MPLIHKFGIFYKIVGGGGLPTETSKTAFIRSLLGLEPYIIYQKAKYKYYFNIKLFIVSDVFMFGNTKTP